MNKILIEGLDLLGKDTLINGILQARGFHHVLHYSKPVELECYRRPGESWIHENIAEAFGGSNSETIKRNALKEYQNRSFRTMFSILRDASYAHVICNRAHLGECVYAPLYRGYDGDYVFELERQFNVQNCHNLRLILLTEDFETSKHFADDGESFDITKRQEEQELFIAAFEKSCIGNKRIICVTDPSTGAFKDRALILEEALK